MSQADSALVVEQRLFGKFRTFTKRPGLNKSCKKLELIPQYSIQDLKSKGMYLSDVLLAAGFCQKLLKEKMSKKVSGLIKNT